MCCMIGLMPERLPKLLFILFIWVPDTLHIIYLNTSKFYLLTVYKMYIILYSIQFHLLTKNPTSGASHIYSIGI